MQRGFSVAALVNCEGDDQDMEQARKTESMATTPIKFLRQPNNHLICPDCHKVYANPVVNPACGHTFCNLCAFSSQVCVEGEVLHCCQIDEATCKMDQLISNRALKAQIDELEVYCPFGLVWSDTLQEYTLDPYGCTEKIPFGNSAEHEKICLYALVPCPYNQDKCGQMQRKDFEDHKSKCQNMPCKNKDSGCSFLGNLFEIGKHQLTCGQEKFRQSTDTSLVHLGSQSVQNAKMTDLETVVQQLVNRVIQLETSKYSLEKQVEDCKRSLQAVESSHKELVQQIRSIIDSNGKSNGSDHLSSGALQRTYSHASKPVVQNERWEMPMQFKCIGTLRGHSEGVWCLRKHGQLLFSCGEDKEIKVWDLEVLAAGCKRTIKEATEKLHTLAVSDEHLYCGSMQGTIMCYSLKDFKVVAIAKDAHKNEVIAAMVVSHKYLFTSSKCVIKVWSTLDLQLVHDVVNLQHWVRSLAFNKAMDRLYSGSHNTIDIWATDKPFVLKGKITHSHGYVNALVVTDMYIIAGTYNQNIHLFNVATLQQCQNLSGHMGAIMDLTVSPSGTFLFSASTDNTIQIWNLDEKFMLRTQVLERHTASVNSVLLHNDLLLSASEDCEIKVFKYFKLQPGFVPMDI